MRKPDVLLDTPPILSYHHEEYGSAVSVIVLYLTIVVCWLLYVSMLAPRNTKKD